MHAHYDVQPAGEARHVTLHTYLSAYFWDGTDGLQVSAWDSPPFALTGRDGWLYARGAADNKGPLLAMIFATIRYFEGAAKGASDDTAPPPLAVVFILEGEGENGSVGFREAVLQNLDLFAGTSMILNCNNTWIGKTSTIVIVV